MKVLLLILAALILAYPFPAQSNTCSPLPQEMPEAGACGERRNAYSETRGVFGNGERPLSLTEDAWND